ncbi:MAG: hypothetical protein ACRERC_27625 [Candidatus Binatia bacterium]
MSPTADARRRRQGIWWMVLLVSFMVVGFAIAMVLPRLAGWRGHEPAAAPTAASGM